MTTPPPGAPQPDPRDKRMGWRPFRWTLAIAVAAFTAAVHWMTAAHMHIGQWATGVPSSPGGYIFIIIAIVLLIAPDADSIAFPGVKVELRRQRAEIDGLRQQIQQSQSNTNSGPQVNLLSLLSDPAALQAVFAGLSANASAIASEETRQDDVPSSALKAFTDPPARFGNVDL